MTKKQDYFHLYYIHGYLSSPDSTKGIILNKKLNVKPIRYRDCEPEELIISDCVKKINETIKNDDNIIANLILNFIFIFSQPIVCSKRMLKTLFVYLVYSMLRQTALYCLLMKENLLLSISTLLLNLLKYLSTIL